MDRQDLSKIFRIYDDNFDGFIDNKELQQIFELIFHEKYIDIQDDLIDFENFCRLVNERLNDIHKTFKYFDKYNSNTINKSLLINIANTIDESSQDYIIRELYDSDIGNIQNINYDY